MSDGGRWAALFRRFSDLDDERREDERARAAEQAAVEDFHRWCQAATDRVMSDLAQAARGRAAEFAAETGHAIEVEYPSHPPIALGEDGPHLSFTRLSLHGTHVHVYSYRGRGGLPVLHLVRTSERNLPRHRRLVSTAGCFVARLPDDSYELRAIPSARGEAASPTSVDDFVYRAFELLVQGSRSGSALG